MLDYWEESLAMQSRFAAATRVIAVMTLVSALHALAALGASTARAQQVADPDYWHQTSERRSTAYRLIYDSSPQTIPTDYDPVREAEEILRARQGSLPASNVEASNLWRVIRNTTVRTALSKSLRFAGELGLVADTAHLGFRIGTGLRSKYIEITA